MKSYFDQLFDASYHESLSGIDKEELRDMTKWRVYDLVSDIDQSLPDHKIVKKLSKRIEKIKYESGAMFALDYSTRGKANCVGVANLMIVSLEAIGREDIIDNLIVGQNFTHIWLEYGDDKKSFSINKFTAKGLTDDISMLISTNLNNLGATLDENDKKVEGMSTYREAIDTNPKNTTSLSNIAGIFYDEGNMSAAVDYFERAIKIDKSSARNIRKLF